MHKLPARFLRALPGTLAFVFLLALLNLAAVAPGRYALALQEGSLGINAWELFVVGVAYDLEPQMFFTMGLLVLAWGMGWIVWLARRKTGRGERFAEPLFMAMIALLAQFFLLFHVSASEFKFQRGAYPTLYDVLLGIRHVDAAVASAPAVLFERYRTLELLFVALWALSLVAFYKRWVRVPRGPGQGLVALVLLLGVGIFGYQIYRKAENIFPSISDSGVVTSPVQALGHTLGARNEIYGHYGLRALLIKKSAHLSQENENGSFIGFPTKMSGNQVPCERHPLARPLFGMGDLPFPAEPGNSLLDAAVEVSQSLFAEMKDEPIVWHVVGETFRGDDIHGIHPAAPEAISPYVSALYASKRDSSQGIIAASRLFESGPRTVQGLSAAFCGVGSLPYQWALVRDFGNLPLRCLPDVVVDAGFAGEALKGYTFTFENQGPFFRFHGFSTLDTNALPLQGPKGSWGFSDRFVFQKTLERVLAKPEPGPQYRVIITLSNHGPNLRPEDMPPEVESRLASLFANRSFQDSDRARLVTLSYTDFAFQEFVTSIRNSPLGRRSIFILHADHSSRDTMLWHGEGVSPYRSHLPFVVLLPPQAAAASPSLRGALTKLNTELDAHSVSLDDVPSLILALLSRSRAMATLPPQWRWHTLGGQATNPRFHFVADDRVKVWGVGAATRLFKADNSKIYEDGEIVPWLEDPETLGVSGSMTLRPVLGFLADFLQEYASRCSSQLLIRTRQIRAGE